MKSFGEILEELGFDKDSRPETQKAFFKHLIKDMESVGSEPSHEITEFKASEEKSGTYEQLSLNLDSEKQDIA